MFMAFLRIREEIDFSIVTSIGDYVSFSSFLVFISSSSEIFVSRGVE